MNQLDKVIRKLISKGATLRFAYEAGPCGYGIYRHLINNNMDCVVVAPSKIPQQSGNRLKNDKLDCLSLAKLHRAGELTPVYVPTEEDEALRDSTGHVSLRAFPRRPSEKRAFSDRLLDDRHGAAILPHLSQYAPNL